MIHCNSVGSFFKGRLIAISTSTNLTGQVSVYQYTCQSSACIATTNEQSMIIKNSCWLLVHFVCQFSKSFNDYEAFLIDSSICPKMS